MDGGDSEKLIQMGSEMLKIQQENIALRKKNLSLAKAWKLERDQRQIAEREVDELNRRIDSYLDGA